METYFISLNINDAMNLIEDAVLRGSLTGEKIDSYDINTPAGVCYVNIYEKHYIRAGNRLTLTVVADNFTGATRVHCISGGGGKGLFGFDWGASWSFEDAVINALAPYRIKWRTNE